MSQELLAKVDHVRNATKDDESSGGGGPLLAFGAVNCARNPPTCQREDIADESAAVIKYFPPGKTIIPSSTKVSVEYEGRMASADHLAKFAVSGMRPPAIDKLNMHNFEEKAGGWVPTS